MIVVVFGGAKITIFPESSNFRTAQEGLSFEMCRTRADGALSGIAARTLSRYLRETSSVRPSTTTAPAVCLATRSALTI